MRIYVAGPMRGYALYNFPAFDAAVERLKYAGHEYISSPAAMDRHAGFDPERDVPDEKFIREAISRDLREIATCDAIYLLKGWSKSRGANLELHLAKFLGLKVLYENVPRIVGFAGKIGAGKDTACEALVARGWQKVAFSDAVWAAVSALNPVLDHRAFNDVQFVRFQGAIRSCYGSVEHAKRVNPEVRRLAQVMGTEVGRGLIGETVWLDALERRLDSLPDCPGVCVTGVRFDNEAEWINQRDGQVVEIRKPDRVGVDPSNGQHASELGISPGLVWGGVENVGTIEDLHHNVASLLGI